MFSGVLKLLVLISISTFCGTTALAMGEKKPNSAKSSIDSLLKRMVGNYTVVSPSDKDCSTGQMQVLVKDSEGIYSFVIADYEFGDMYAVGFDSAFAKGDSIIFGKEPRSGRATLSSNDSKLEFSFGDILCTYKRK